MGRHEGSCSRDISQGHKAAIKIGVVQTEGTCIRDV